jgi:ring-1,2-phenylacetyl-CoA epoxidase subunit PaaE
MFHKLRISDIRTETNDTVSISFDVPNELRDQFNYVSGQYVNLKVNVNGDEERRAYSLCSAPKIDADFRFAVKQVEKGKVSTYLNQSVKEGDILEVSVPEGHFVVPADTDAQSHVFIAGGSGITPIYSMIRSILNSNSNSVCTLFYVNRSQEQVIFGSELKALQGQYGSRFQYYAVCTKSGATDPLLEGRPDPKKIMGWFKNWVDLAFDHEFYLCGPQGLMDAALQAFETSRIDSKRIHKEYFAAPDSDDSKDAAVAEEQDCRTTILLDDEEHELDIKKGVTVLDAALQADLDAPYSCRGAVCSSCVAKVEKGSVNMRMNYTLTDAEVEEGYILTCQAVPTSPELSVDFDA